MIQAGLSFILKAYRDFTGAGMYMALYYIALFYIWKSDREKENHSILLYPFLFMLAVIWNPVIAGSVLRKVMNWDTEARLYWVFCLIPMIAYAGTKFILGERGTKKRLLTGAAVVLLFTVCGTLKFTNAEYQKATNPYRLPQEVVDVCDIILEDTKEEKPLVVVPYDIVSFPRQYSRRIQLLYGENVRFRIAGERDPVILGVYEEMLKDEPDIQSLTLGLKEKECDYIVFDLDRQVLTDTLESGKFELLETVGNYSVYKYKG